MTAEHKQLEQLLAAESRAAGAWCWINSGQAVRQHGSGWVDAVVIGRQGVLFIELKSEDGRRTRAQVRVARMLMDRGLQYRMYRRCDFAAGAVREDLEAIG